MRKDLDLRVAAAVVVAELQGPPHMSTEDVGRVSALAEESQHCHGRNADCFEWTIATAVVECKVAVAYG